ncbi:hypothetical protein ABIB51_000210 [Arthrobacter sp. UYCu712]
MSGLGGKNPVRCSAALIVSMLLTSGISSCAYDDGDARPAAEPSGRPAPSVPTKGPDILSLEARNYAELEKRLSAAPGSVLLGDSGPADGPGVGFSRATTVTTAGAYTVTAACVGTPDAQIILSQDPGNGPLSLELDCSGILSQVVELQAGYVGANLIRPDPTGPWTGAVAGIRITIG